MDRFMKIRDSMKNYNMLNSLMPKHAVKKYPYNPWSDVKVQFTLKQIQLESDGAGAFFIVRDDHKKGGKDKQIIIF